MKEHEKLYQKQVSKSDPAFCFGPFIEKTNSVVALICFPLCNYTPLLEAQIADSMKSFGKHGFISSFDFIQRPLYD